MFTKALARPRSLAPRQQLGKGKPKAAAAKESTGAKKTGRKEKASAEALTV